MAIDFWEELLRCHIIYICFVVLTQFQHFDISKFDFYQLLFAASYLIVMDSFLVLILNGCSISPFKVNSMILPTLHSLLTLNLDYLRTTEWFKSKFHHFNEGFIDGILHLMYLNFDVICLISSSTVITMRYISIMTFWVEIIGYKIVTFVKIRISNITNRYKVH